MTTYNQLYQAPYVDTESATIPASAITTDTTTPALVAPFNGIISGVSYAAVSAVAGVTTNNRTFTLYNLTQGVAIATLALNTGTNLVAGVAKPLILSGTPANLQVNAGDVLELQSVHGGTGIADPGGVLLITVGGVDSHVTPSPYYEIPSTQPLGSDPLHLGAASI